VIFNVLSPGAELYKVHVIFFFLPAWFFSPQVDGPNHKQRVVPNFKCDGSFPAYTASCSQCYYL
jgi:hypothetical protein